MAIYSLPSFTTGSISTANGSALVRLGDTTIVCGVKAEIAEPDLDSPEQGFIGTTRATLPPMHNYIQFIVAFVSSKH